MLNYFMTISKKLNYVFNIFVQKILLMILQIKYYVAFVFILLFAISHSQVTMIWTLTNPKVAASPAIDSAKNTLENTKSLETLFAKLYTLKTNKSAQNVIFTHIGDSHIQADKITAVLRNEFQDYFGNAGRRLLFPFHVAKTNEPSDLQSTSISQWQSSRLSKMNPDVACGIAAYGIKTNQQNAEIIIQLKDSIPVVHLKRS